MKRTLLALVVLVSCAMAGEKLVVEWNFDNGLDSNGIKMSPRGSAVLVDEEGRGKVLNPSTTYDGKPAGLILVGGARAELLPAAFTYSLDVKYVAPNPAPAKGLRMYLLDSKYADKEGLTMMMNIDEKGNASINLSVGTDQGVNTCNAKARVLTDGKWHSIKVTAKYPKLEIFVDGASVGMYVLKGDIVAPKQRLTIGDRVASSYGPFHGLIDNVKLTTEE